MSQTQKIRIKKYSGELVPFKPESLKHSLRRSGASEDQVKQVYAAIQDELYEGISTRELYQLAFNKLKECRNSFAARYSLKKALRDLGPEGYPFEKWIGRLLTFYGFQAITSQTVQGSAVTHEIDVVAAKGSRMLAIECKFRNDVDAKISVTTPMYILSRVKDISNGNSYEFFGKKRTFTEGWLVTNAYLTSDSINFSKHYGLNLLGWDYPSDNSIKLLVDNTKLYPITCLTSLSEQHKKKLLEKDCIVVGDLTKNPKLLSGIEIAKKQQQAAITEAQELIQYKGNDTEASIE